MPDPLIGELQAWLDERRLLTSIVDLRSLIPAGLKVRSREDSDGGSAIEVGPEAGREPEDAVEVIEWHEIAPDAVLDEVDFSARISVSVRRNGL